MSRLSRRTTESQSSGRGRSGGENTAAGSSEDRLIPRVAIADTQALEDEELQTDVLSEAELADLQSKGEL